jgi:hypothetical protein
MGSGISCPLPGRAIDSHSLASGFRWPSKDSSPEVKRK